MAEAPRSEVDRLTLLSLSWFPPDREILGVETRSLSLASHQFVRTLGLRSLDPHADLSPSEEVAELNAYAWVHTAEIPEVEALAWTGEWREAINYEEADEAATLEIVAEWRELRQRILGLLAVTSIEILPRPKGKNDKTPSKVCGVTRFAHQVATVMRETGASREEVLWHLPKWEANQIYHRALRHDGAWTVARREKSAPDDFSEFTMSAAEEEEEDDGA